MVMAEHGDSEWYAERSWWTLDCITKSLSLSMSHYLSVHTDTVQSGVNQSCLLTEVDQPPLSRHIHDIVRESFHDRSSIFTRTFLHGSDGYATPGSKQQICS